ncbi:hypothetical protein [Candidatus Enterococcus clewellii]|uniref:Uncharacterized protein n=1 Tax=Candidatus Enterococcus clewellii TaxID=1834193 RepID=A0A242K235_9ENTE|nr:hypothetical protein [Enterococcus sp. 9E7_DIV0242]OTP12652.1 hypothetical protein A5888_003230 [Enterococcus sp. 9E7_DIV0242]
MNNGLTKFLDYGEGEIITDNFVIKDNLLKFDDFTLQISNVSHLYAGKRILKIPNVLFIIFVISLLIVFVQPIIGLIGMALSGYGIFRIYQNYSNSKMYLQFNLNSGTSYFINFKDEEFLDEVRAMIEAAFNNKHMSSTINVAEQKIINGDHHIVQGDNANINSGTQKDAVINSHNSDSFNTTDDHSSVTVGDIQNSAIHSSSFGNKNTIQTETEIDGSYNWTAIEAALQAVIATIKIDSPVKVASVEALAAAQQRNEKQFEVTVKNNKTEFLSDLFQNTASGVLSQIVCTILGV